LINHAATGTRYALPKKTSLRPFARAFVAGGTGENFPVLFTLFGPVPIVTPQFAGAKENVDVFVIYLGVAIKLRLVPMERATDFDVFDFTASIAANRGPGPHSFGKLIFFTEVFG